MVSDRVESRATARLTGILHRKKMMVGGMPVLPVFGTLTCVLLMVEMKGKNGQFGISFTNKNARNTTIYHVLIIGPPD